MTLTLAKNTFYMVPSSYDEEEIEATTNGTLSAAINSSSTDDGRITLRTNNGKLYVAGTSTEGDATTYIVDVTATLGDQSTTQQITVYLGQSATITELNVYGYSVDATIVASGGDPTTQYSYNSATYKGVTFTRVGSNDGDDWTNGSSKAGIMLMRKTDYVTFFVRNAYATNTNMFSPQPDTLDIWEDYEITPDGTNLASTYAGTYNVRYSNKNGNPKIGYSGWAPITVNSDYAIPIIGDTSVSRSIIGWYPVSTAAREELQIFIDKAAYVADNTPDDKM